MPYCTHCGSYANDTDKFCGSCGATINSRTSTEVPQYQTQQAYYNPQPQPQNVSKMDSIM